MAKIELEVGTCPTGVLLALKSVEGRVHHVTAIEMTNDEALEISKLINKELKKTWNLLSLLKSINISFLEK